MRFLLLCDLDCDGDGTGTGFWEGRSDIRVRISDIDGRPAFLRRILSVAFYTLYFSFSHRSDVYIDCFAQ
jgi:hypothetical protein